MTSVSKRPLTAMIDPAAGPPDCAAYERAGGWQATRRALGGLSPAEIIDMVTRSKLRGRGGAGFGTGQKWSFVPKEPAELPRVYRRAICSVIRQRYQACSDLHRRLVRLRQEACSRLAPAGVDYYTSPPT